MKPKFHTTEYIWLRHFTNSPKYCFARLQISALVLAMFDRLRFMVFCLLQKKKKKQQSSACKTGQIGHYFPMP
ncbi:MAG: hypothetical protein Q6362_012640 [Candidatus Wukongarchaeota archaeon]|nr:hypothetical protein [Candidatus Wukongarchaeota archaeon]